MAENRKFLMFRVERLFAVDRPSVRIAQLCVHVFDELRHVIRVIEALRSIAEREDFNSIADYVSRMLQQDHEIIKNCRSMRWSEIAESGYTPMARV